MELDFGRDFTEDELKYLSTLSNDELEKLYGECEDYIMLADTNQQNRKILINALYGALGNIHFRFYSLQNAAAITTFGQLAIQWVERKVNEYLNKVVGSDGVDYVIAIDTDSIYVNVEEVINKVGLDRFKTTDELIDFMDAFGTKKMEPIIDSGYQELRDYMNNREHLMLMDREAIAAPPLGSNGCGGFWKAKKRYALNVYDMEGTRYASPKMKIMGIETQSSSTPKAVQDALKESIRIILQEGEKPLQEYYKKFESEYNGLDYKVVAKVSSANNIAKYDDNGYPASGCPGHVRGVLAHNRAIKDIAGASPIQEGEKVMVVPMKQGNKFNEKVFAWASGTEINPAIREEVLRMVDYPVMFDKTFKKPLGEITDAVGFQYEKKATLADLFDF